MLEVLKKEPYERSENELKRLARYIASKKAFAKFNFEEKKEI